MGMDPATMLAISSMISTGGQLWSGQNQNNTNQQNFAAQQQARNQLLALTGGMMLPGQNPYASAYQSQLNNLGATPPQVAPLTGSDLAQYLGPLIPGYQQPPSTNPLQQINPTTITDPGSGLTQVTPITTTAPAVTTAPATGGGLTQINPQTQYEQGGAGDPGIGNNNGQTGDTGYGPNPGAPGGPFGPGNNSGGATGGTGTMDPNNIQGIIQQIMGAFAQTPVPQTTQQPFQLGPSPFNTQFPVSAPPTYNPLNAMLQQAFTYNPSTLGAAPQVDMAQLGLPQLGQINPYQAQMMSAAQMGQTPQMSASQISGPSQFNMPTLQQPNSVSTQFYNPGQDALMQMASRSINAPNDWQLNSNLNRQASGGMMFDDSDVFRTLHNQDQRQLDAQVDELHAGATDLGKRFGTAMNQNEALLRGQVQSANSARDAQIAQQSFEAAQNRAVSALGTQANYQQSRNQLPFQNAQLQQQAAASAGGLASQSLGMRLQGQQYNASNDMATQSGNLQAILQAGMQRQSLQQQAALANQGAQQQTGQFNIGNLMQQMQYNAGNQQQAGMANQSAAMQAALAGQGINAQLLQQQGTNQLGYNSQLLQGLLANMGQQSQYGMANANILNQAGQYNAGAGMQQSQFNAGQGQAYNQLVAQILGQSQGAQQWQDQYNAGLLGVYAGVPMPQMQPSAMPGAISGVGNNLVMQALLQQYMGQQGAAQYGGQQPAYGAQPGGLIY